MSDDDIEKKIRQLSDIRTLTLYSIITAMAFVVGLFWNEAIKATIEQIIPQGDTLPYKYLAAIIVTIVVVIFVYIIIHGQRVAERRLAQLQRQLKKNAKRRRKGVLGLR